MHGADTRRGQSAPADSVRREHESPALSGEFCAGVDCACGRWWEMENGGGSIPGGGRTLPNTTLRCQSERQLIAESPVLTWCIDTGRWIRIKHKLSVLLPSGNGDCTKSLRPFQLYHSHFRILNKWKGYPGGMWVLAQRRVPPRAGCVLGRAGGVAVPGVGRPGWARHADFLLAGSGNHRNVNAQAVQSEIAQGPRDCHQCPQGASTQMPSLVKDRSLVP